MVLRELLTGLAALTISLSACETKRPPKQIGDCMLQVYHGQFPTENGSIEYKDRIITCPKGTKMPFHHSFFKYRNKVVKTEKKDTDVYRLFTYER